jgi:aspartyl aminopeptidase
MKLGEEQCNWNIQWENSYYITRADSSIIAFKTPVKPANSTLSLLAVGSHTDSPCFKVKTNPINTSFSPNALNLEVYGGALLNSWLDRDLGIGGMVWGKTDKGELKKTTIRTESLFRIPQLSIHLDRGVNQNGLKLNPQTEMHGLLATEFTNEDFNTLVKELSGLNEILSFELYSFDTQNAQLGGAKEEFLYSGRLDNLAMAQSSFAALIDSNNSDSLQLAVSFNHEEVGSESFEGARSNFLPIVLKKLYSELKMDIDSSLSNSLFISADMAHAWHPGFSDRFDPQNHPKVNAGVVLKVHANARYGTSGSEIALIKNLCSENEIPLQSFHSRNDLSCGSTIGPACASQLGIPTIDLGNPMFSMHSSREMSGVKDVESIGKFFNCFYQSNLSKESFQ